MNTILLSRVLALIRTALFAVLVMGTVGIFLPSYLGLLHRTPALDLRLLGFLPLMAGAFIALHCAFDFAWHGRGTPAPFDPTIHLVVSGMYRYARNPMYAGVGVCMIGEWLVWGTNPAAALIYLAAYTAAVSVFVVAYEERELQKRFGEEYSRYRQQVPRFVPRLQPWMAAREKSAAGSKG